jgi:phosphoribosylaminoimidazole-succinocarboxamide synthase
MQVTHPDKEAVRRYMQQRREEQSPPPSPEEVRRQLGWELVEAERGAKPR